jgi:hypothetical protein
MTLLEILFTVILAIVIGLLFYYVFRVSGPWGSFWTFLLVLILGGLAASAWIAPVGPVYYEVAWIPILLIILIFALFLAAATPPGARRHPYKTAAEEELEPNNLASTGAVAAFGIFFFLLIIFLLVVAVIGIVS